MQPLTTGHNSFGASCRSLKHLPSGVGFGAAELFPGLGTTADDEKVGADELDECCLVFDGLGATSAADDEAVAACVSRGSTEVTKTEELDGTC